jgi:CO/xanthine dehydrogenase Mo-binding subunit
MLRVAFGGAGVKLRAVDAIANKLDVKPGELRARNLAGGLCARLAGDRRCGQ